MIYFDNAATSYPKPPEVFEAMRAFMDEFGGNPGRSGHRMATGAEAMIGEARNAVSKFFGAKYPERCIFTLNCSDALNIAIKGFVREGDHVISSMLEHNSINRPLQRMSDEGRISFHRVGIQADGNWGVDEVLDAIRPETRLVAITHCPNAIGVICPVAELGKALRERHPNVFYLVDAAQTAGVVPLDVEDACIDFLAFPGHKGLFAPTGTGALIVGPRVGEGDLAAWREGGTGGDSASPHQPSEWPHFLEGGTPNTMGISGLLAGLRFVKKEGLQHILAHERKLQQRMIDGLATDDRFIIHGTKDATKRAGVLSITIPDQDVAEVFTVPTAEIHTYPGDVGV